MTKSLTHLSSVDMTVPCGIDASIVEMYAVSGPAGAPVHCPTIDASISSGARCVDTPFSNARPYAHVGIHAPMLRHPNSRGEISYQS